MEDKTNSIKQCPYCGEDIHVNAVKCPYCRTWLNGEPVNHVDETRKSSNQPVSHTQDGLERFLDNAAEKVTNIKLLKWLCYAAMFFCFYDSISMQVDADAYYRSRFLNGIVWIESHLHWLLALLEGAVEIGILLALRKILNKHGIKTWISLCIVAGAAWYIFDAIASGTIVSGIFLLAWCVLSIEYGYKMSRSQITNIKYVGYLEIFTAAFTLAFLFLLPLLILVFATSDKLGQTELRWLSLIGFIVSVKLYRLMYKLFKVEYSEN